MTSGGPEPVPLARLLTMASRLLVDGLHARLEQQGWSGVRVSYGFVLLALRAGATSAGELAAVLGVSKQAASKLVESMERAGLVRRRTAPEDARVRLLELSPTGHQLLGDVEAAYRDLEAEWGRLLGEVELEEVRARLTAVLLAAYDGALPAVRPLG